ncbi:MAG: hypothetical protein Q8P44_08290, partial [Dehalococcoidia bacterium]|nr:hypothetical protein [Dehalococcoidia bacterium]
MKRILICMLILVFVLLIGVAPPLSRPTMRAQAAPETKWVLQETRVPLATFQKDAPQPDGSLFKYTVNASETTLSYRSQSVKEGKVQTDVTYTWTFERPPRELTPGQPVELRIQGKVIGKASSISIIARYSYHADYVENFQEKSGDEVATGRLNSTNLEMSAVLRFTVPPTPPAGRGGQITLVAGTDIVQKVVGTPGQVVWIYRTEAPPPARNEAPPPATVFAGYVLAHDNQNHAFPLPDAPVRIRLELEGNVRVVNTLTNRQGLYQVAVEDVTDKTAYRVQVALAERTGVYQVLWYTDLHPATYVTAEREVGPDRGPDSAKNIVLANLLFEPRMTQGKPVRVEADGSLTDVRQRTVDEDRAAALSYARLYTAMAYGRDRLGVAYDHKLPLAVILGQESSLRSHYDPAGRIEITAEDMNIVFSGEPDNLEWHEFGHFLTQDSAWFGDNLIVLIGADESNHAGVKNRTSQDSVLEGAAEFLVLLFKGVAARTDGQAPYMIGDYLLNLQDNDFDNYDEESKEWVSLEEFHFAALLWDVMDQDRQPEPGDHVAWG